MPPMAHGTGAGLCKHSQDACYHPVSCGPQPAALCGVVPQTRPRRAGLSRVAVLQSPVTSGRASDKGFYDTLGNAWEWGEDHYSAFPGFRVHDYYADFSAPCFGGEHQLVGGGRGRLGWSWAWQGVAGHVGMARLCHGYLTIQCAHIAPHPSQHTMLFCRC